MKKLKDIKSIYLDIFIVAFVALLGGMITVQGDLTTYLATPIAIANPNLYTLDFSIQEFLRPNAQNISDYFCTFFLNLGMSWQSISVIGYIITVGIFGAGIIAISRHFYKDNSWIMSGSIMFLALFAVSGLRIGRNPIWYHSFYYAQMGFCVAVWGFYFALKKKWYKSFICLTIATMFHFTVGCYSSAYVVVFLVIDSIRNKKYKQLLSMIPWIVVCISIYLVMYLSGSTSTGLLSNDAFIKIHAYLRHPHHHIPSSWERLEWLNYISYIIGVGTLIFVCIKDNKYYKNIKYIFIISTSLMAMILVVNYLFIEVFPLSFIGKLQPARCVFIYRFFLAAILSYCAYLQWYKKQYYIAALIILFAAIPQIDIKTYSGFFILILGIVLFINSQAIKKEHHIIKHLSSLVIYGLIGGIAFLISGNLAIIMIFVKIIAFIVICYMMSMLVLLPLKNSKKAMMKLIILLTALAVLFIPLIDVRGQFEEIKIRSFSQVYKARDLNPDLVILAQRYMDNTPDESLFFGDPYNIDTSYFRMYSLRSSVIAYKNMPFTDSGMIEWVDRLTNMGGLSINDEGYYNKNYNSFSEMSPTQKLEYCKKYNATHLLINLSSDSMDDYTKIGFSEFDSQGSLYILSLE